MKRLLSLTALLLWVNNSYASDWMFVGDTDEQRIELDLESIKKIGSGNFTTDRSTTQFWVKKTIINDLTKDGLSVGDYSLSLFNINCLNDTLGFKSAVRYKNNKIFDNYIDSYVKMQPIVPETIGSSYSKIVCAR